MKLIKYICFICIFITITTGCGCYTTTDAIDMKNRTINQYKNQITQLELKVKQLQEENKKLTKKTNITNYKYFLDNYYYKEDKIQTMLGYKEYTGTEPLKALPYSDAIEVNSGSASGVKIISTVRNKYDEHWALVEFYSHSDRNINNYGFVKLDYIEETNDNSTDCITSSIKLGIENIHINDPIEKAISILGKDYSESKGFERGIIHYGEITESEKQFYFGKGLNIFYDIKTNKIWGIKINDTGYFTAEGYTVGNKAIEAVKYYKSIYPMNGEVHFEKDVEEYKYFQSTIGNWSFDVGNNYVLKLEIDSKELTKDSIIIGIQLMPIWYFFT